MKRIAIILGCLVLVACLANAQVSLSALPGYNQEKTILASAARTATPTAVTVTNPTCRGVMFVIDVTAVTSTPSVTFTIDGYDVAKEDYVNILTSAAITTTGTTVLTIFPGAPVTANVSTNKPLPRQFRIVATHADTDSITYSVGAWFF